MRKSLNAWTVDSALGFEEMFQQLQEAGFDGVELNIDGSNGSRHALSMDTTLQELYAIRDISEKYSLPIVSISSSLYSGKMGSPNPEDRAFSCALMEKQLICAKTLGASGILCVPGGSSPRISLKQDWENSLATMRSMRPIIEKYGLYADVENVWNGFFCAPYAMADFIDQVDCPLVGAYYDVGNVIAFSWSESWIEILDKRIHHVHVKDFKRNDGLNSGGAFVDLGLGDVNWPAVMSALKQAGFDGYLTGEVFKSDDAMSFPEYYRSITKAMDDILKK